MAKSEALVAEAIERVHPKRIGPTRAGLGTKLPPTASTCSKAHIHRCQKGRELVSIFDRCVPERTSLSMLPLCPKKRAGAERLRTLLREKGR
jgi:hypothetical protein